MKATLFSFAVLVFLALACASEANQATVPPNGSDSRSGIRRIVLVPVDTNGNDLVSYERRQGDCIIRVKESAIGINIYPDLEHTRNAFRIGILYWRDGVVVVDRLMWGPDHDYRWALISVRGITGWVHADPPWTMEAPPCTAESYDAGF